MSPTMCYQRVRCSPSHTSCTPLVSCNRGVCHSPSVLPATTVTFRGDTLRIQPMVSPNAWMLKTRGACPIGVSGLRRSGSSNTIPIVPRLRNPDPLVDMVKLTGPIQDDVKFKVKHPGANFVSGCALALTRRKVGSLDDLQKKRQLLYDNNFAPPKATRKRKASDKCGPGQGECTGGCNSACQGLCTTGMAPAPCGPKVRKSNKREPRSMYSLRGLGREPRFSGPKPAEFSGGTENGFNGSQSGYMGSQGGFQAPRNSYQGSESGIQEQQQQSESQEGGKPRYIYRFTEEHQIRRSTSGGLSQDMSRSSNQSIHSLDRQPSLDDNIQSNEYVGGGGGNQFILNYIEDSSQEKPELQGKRRKHGSRATWSVVRSMNTSISSYPDSSQEEPELQGQPNTRGSTFTGSVVRSGDPFVHSYPGTAQEKPELQGQSSMHGSTATGSDGRSGHPLVHSYPGTAQEKPELQGQSSMHGSTATGSVVRSGHPLVHSYPGTSQEKPELQGQSSMHGSTATGSVVRSGHPLVHSYPGTAQEKPELQGQSSMHGSTATGSVMRSGHPLVHSYPDSPQEVSGLQGQPNTYGSTSTGSVVRSGDPSVHSYPDSAQEGLELQGQPSMYGSSATGSVVRSGDPSVHSYPDSAQEELKLQKHPSLHGSTSTGSVVRSGEPFVPSYPGAGQEEPELQGQPSMYGSSATGSVVRSGDPSVQSYPGKTIFKEHYYQRLPSGMLVETTSEIEEIFAPPGHNQTMPDNSFIEVSSLQEAEEEVHYPPYNFQGDSSEKGADREWQNW